jgi:hypothetical protein
MQMRRGDVVTVVAAGDHGKAPRPMKMGTIVSL